MVDNYIVTCEHGGNHIPAAYRAWFHGKDKLLNSHAGYDPGALTMARSLATALNAPMLASTTSRLLIDLNRPANHPQLYSMIIREATAELRAEIAQRHYQPYWVDMKNRVQKSEREGNRLIHISSHSFAPVLNGKVRQADVGLLYDPARIPEAQLCARWKASLATNDSSLRVRRNYPYYGKSAGLTEQMRLRFTADTYVGIELEVNQAVVLAADQRWARLRRVLCSTLLSVLAA